VVTQPDERHANRTASVLEWYDKHRAYSITSGSNEEKDQYNCVVCGAIRKGSRYPVTRLSMIQHEYNERVV